MNPKQAAYLVKRIILLQYAASDGTHSILTVTAPAEDAIVLIYRNERAAQQALRALRLLSGGGYLGGRISFSYFDTTGKMSSS